MRMHASILYICIIEYEAKSNTGTRCAGVFMVTHHVFIIKKVGKRTNYKKPIGLVDICRTV